MKIILFVSFLFLFIGIAFGQSAYGYGSKSSVIHENLINFAGGVENLLNEDEPSPMHPFMLQLLVDSNITSPLTNTTVSTDGDFWHQGAKDFSPNTHSFSNSHAQDHYDYIYGGIYEDETYADIFFRYDKSKRFWEQLYPNITNGQQPGPLAHHCSVVDGNRLVLTGGQVSPDEMSDAIYHIDLTDLNAGWTKVNASDFGTNSTYVNRAGHWCFFGDSDDKENVIFIGEGFIGNTSYSQYADSIFGFSISDDAGDLIIGSVESNVIVELEQEGCDDVIGACGASNLWPRWDNSIQDQPRWGHWGFSSDFYYNRETEKTFFVITGGFNIYSHENGTNRYVPATNETFFKWIDVSGVGAVPADGNTPLYSSAYDDGVDLGTGSFQYGPEDFNVRAQHVAFEFNFQIFISNGRSFDTWNYTGSWDETIFSPFCDLWFWDPVTFDNAPYQHIPSILPIYDVENPTNPRYIRWPLGYIDGYREDIGAIGESDVVASFATPKPLTGHNGIGYHSFDSLDIIGQQIAYNELFGLNSGKFLTIFESDQRNSKRSETDLSKRYYSDPVDVDKIKMQNVIIGELDDSTFTPGKYTVLACLEGTHQQFNHYSIESEECSAAVHTDNMYSFFGAYSCFEDFESAFSSIVDVCELNPGMMYRLKDIALKALCEYYYLCGAISLGKKDINLDENDELFKEIFELQKRGDIDMNEFSNLLKEYLFSNEELSRSIRTYPSEQTCSFVGEIATFKSETCSNRQLVQSCTIAPIAKGKFNLPFAFSPLTSLGTNKDSFFSICPVDDDFSGLNNFFSVFNEDFTVTTWANTLGSIGFPLDPSSCEVPSFINFIANVAVENSCYFFSMQDNIERQKTWSTEGIRYYTESDGTWIGCQSENDEKETDGKKEYICYEAIQSRTSIFQKDWKYSAYLISKYSDNSQAQNILDQFATYGIVYPEMIAYGPYTWPEFSVDYEEQVSDFTGPLDSEEFFDRWNYIAMYHRGLQYLAIYKWGFATVDDVTEVLSDPIKIMESIELITEVINILSSGGSCITQDMVPFLMLGPLVAPLDV